MTTTNETLHWKERITAKQNQQLASIPKEWILPNLPSSKGESNDDVSELPRTCGLLSTLEIEITESHVEVILSNLKKGVWTALQVTTAFSKRAIVVHQLVNCLTEVFIEKALIRAAELDDYFKRTGSVVGPLHGLPVSLKDQICVKGLDATIGFVSWIDKPAEKNAVIVDILESLGAVFYVKTNVPQGLLWSETYNHIFGRTLNPFNRSLTAGGSSGGEGALIALKGSPLGVGTDIGGSIRIPSGYTGLYGLRPSTKRIPIRGGAAPMAGQHSILPVFGPMTTSMEGVKIFMKTVLDKEPWNSDAQVIRKHWDEDEYNLVGHNNGKDLCFAVLWDDGCVVPHPPVRRGLETAKEALIRAGHKVIDWDPPHHVELGELARSIWSANGNVDVEEFVSASGEPVIATMSTNAENLDEIPDPVQYTSLTASEFWQLNVTQQNLKQSYLDLWQATAALTGTGRPVDAIIAPMAPFVAPPHGEGGHEDYTSVWNVLDYPTCVIPVGSVVNPVLDAKNPRDSFFGDADRQNWTLYNPEAFKNAPLAIQIVGRAFEDEALVGLSEIIDQALKDHKRGL